MTRYLGLWERLYYTVAFERGLEMTKASVALNEQRRGRLVSDLLTGTADEILVLSVGLASSPLVVARVRDRDAAVLAAVGTMIDETARQHGGVALTGYLGGDLAVIADHELDLASQPITAGVATCDDVHQLPDAFRSASTALQTAAALQLPGVHTEESLGARVAVATDHGTGNRLVARYLAPLDDLGAFGAELVATLRCYLANDLRIDRTAAELFVHRSTLKYRLRRYEELAGVDLRAVDDIVGLWWALARTTPAVNAQRS